MRVNKAGCLDRCAGGPVAVVYPEGTWYSYVDTADIDEIVESHLKNGQVVSGCSRRNLGADSSSYPFYGLLGLQRFLVESASSSMKGIAI